MNTAALSTGHISEDDRLVEKVALLSEWAFGGEVVPAYQDEMAPDKGTIYGAQGQMTATCGPHAYGATSGSRCDAFGIDGEFSSCGAILSVAPGSKGCIGVADMFWSLGIAATMDAKPTEVSARPVRLREIRSAPELYADLDLERIKERAAELRGASSDSEAISIVLGRSVQIVVHSDE